MQAGDGLCEELEWCDAVDDVAEDWGVEATQVKPCVVQILMARDGGQFAAFVLTTELQRLRLPEERAVEIVCLWNMRNRDPLPTEWLRRTVHSVYDHPHVLACGVLLTGWCVELDECSFYQDTISASRPEAGRTAAASLERLGWCSPLLTAVERLTYHTLADLEAARGVGLSGLITTSIRELAECTRVSRSAARQAVRSLNSLGLIDYDPGWVARRCITATRCEIRRIIPIPDPPSRHFWQPREVRQRIASGWVWTRVGGPSAAD